MPSTTEVKEHATSRRAAVWEFVFRLASAAILTIATSGLTFSISALRDFFDFHGSAATALSWVESFTLHIGVIVVVLIVVGDFAVLIKRMLLSSRDRDNL